MIKLNNIKKEYQFHKKKIVVLDGLNLKIEADSFIAIKGKSGTGKTTILNLIAGLIRPTSGSVYYLDHRVSSWFDFTATRFRRDNIGFIFQHFNLIPYYTVLENITIPLKFSSIPLKVHQDKALYLLDQLKILDKKDYYPNLLSGGQIQRVAIARALINDPKLIIADEPSGNLDLETSRDLLDIFMKLNTQDQVAFVIVSHDDEFIYSAKEKYILKNKTLEPLE